MSEPTLSKSAALMALLVLLAVGSWEIHLRWIGTPLDYDDGKELWADKRAQVYDSPEKTTVFIGSSRVKFDIDIDTWQKGTGKKAVQLGMVGVSPLPILVDLANDKKFAGRVIIDVTEPLFFDNDSSDFKQPDQYIAYYKHETPAQKASFVLNHLLESQFIFLDQDNFSLNAELDHWKLPNRPGVFVMPDFPQGFGGSTFERQSGMSKKFLADTTLQVQVQQIWAFLIALGRSAPPPKENPIPIILRTVQTAVAKIRARGGDVVFTRTPSSGPFLAGEQHVFPRQQMWDPLLATTGATGFYFSDNPATTHFICPEWSHLKPSDAILYTKALIDELPSSFK
jgi:hypothetical protein